MDENKNTTENEGVTETELSTEVLIPREQYEQLLALLAEYQEDLVKIVTIFGSIAAMFSGKTSALSMLPVITRMLSNPEQLERFKEILPIFEKYIKPADAPSE